LKIFVAENLPGAVKMFADALTGGDTTKLFKLMEDGEIGLKELQKVIDHMASIVDPELVNKMANTPAKKFEKMRTAWVRMLEATNDAGILNLMVKTFGEMTDVLEDLAKWVRLNKEGFKTLGNVIGQTWLTIKTAIQILLPYWKELLSLLIVSKVYAFATALQVLGKSITGVLARLFLVPLLVAAAVVAFLDLNDAVNGKNSFFKDWAKDDKWYSGFAKFVLLLADAAKYTRELLTSGAIELYGNITGNQALVESAKASRLQATNRSEALQGELLAENSDTGKVLWKAFSSSFSPITAFKHGMDEVSAARDRMNSAAPPSTVQPTMGQGIYFPEKSSQPSQSSQVNHITVNAPTREGGEIARIVAQSLPNYIRDK